MKKLNVYIFSVVVFLFSSYIYANKDSLKKQVNYSVSFCIVYNPAQCGGTVPEGYQDIEEFAANKKYFYTTKKITSKAQIQKLKNYFITDSVGCVKIKLPKGKYYIYSSEKIKYSKKPVTENFKEACIDWLITPDIEILVSKKQDFEKLKYYERCNPFAPGYGVKP